MTSPYTKKEKFIRHKNEIWINGDEITPTRYHQLEDEYLQLERDLGAMLRFQRDRDGRIP